MTNRNPQVREINFDLLAAGCDTDCLHCYVNGGPGRRMALTDIQTALEKLDAIAARLTVPAAFTLDNEPLGHPDIVEIIHACAATRHIRYDHHGMTTGLALMRRADREAVLGAYRSCGYDRFGVTLHGIGPHHDEIVRRGGAFEQTVAAARLFHSSGCRLEISIMMNRYIPQDRAAISRLLAELAPERIYFVIPIFAPTARMLAFEPYRARREDFDPLAGYLTDWGQDEGEIFRRAELYSARTAARAAEGGIDWGGLDAASASELYLTIHSDLTLYVGNTGAETACLGRLDALDPQKAAGILNALPGNRDYGAFYDLNRLPDGAALGQVLAALEGNPVYGDFPSCLYRALAELGVPTRLLFH